MAKIFFFLLLILMQRFKADAQGCFFRLVEDVLYQPVPLEIPQERSITSCGLYEPPQMSLHGRIGKNVCAVERNEKK